MKTLLITNPLSGNYSNRKINFLISSLNKYNFLVERYNLKEKEPIGDVINAIDASRYNNIIFAFGDGTINSACNAMLNRDDYNKFNILVFPLGTANVVAMELNCDTIKKSVKAFLKQNIKKVHLGLANDRYFISMASSGFDAIAVNSVNKKFKKYFGKVAYIYAAFKALFNKKRIFTTIDGETYENILTCASNGKYYGIKIKVTDSDLSDNIFDVVINKKINIINSIKYLFNKKSNNSILHLQGNSLEINGNKNLPFQMDGDCYGRLPLTVKTTNKFLNFFIND